MLSNRDQSQSTADQWSCGRGTDTELCGEKPIYIEPSSPGGCEETCDLTLLLASIDPIGAFDKFSTCSDGGEGSVRVRFKMPKQTIYKWDETSQRGFTRTEFSEARHFQTGMLMGDETAAGVTRKALNDVDRSVAENVASNYYYWDFACPYGTQV